MKDKLTRLAEENWSPVVLSGHSPPAFNPALVEEIYNSELGGGSDSPPAARRCVCVCGGGVQLVSRGWEGMCGDGCWAGGAVL